MLRVLRKVSVVVLSLCLILSVLHFPQAVFAETETLRYEGEGTLGVVFGGTGKTGDDYAGYVGFDTEKAWIQGKGADIKDYKYCWLEYPVFVSEPAVYKIDFRSTRLCGSNWVATSKLLVNGEDAYAFETQQEDVNWGKNSAFAMLDAGENKLRFQITGLVSGGDNMLRYYLDYFDITKADMSKTVQASESAFALECENFILANDDVKIWESEKSSGGKKAGFSSGYSNASVKNLVYCINAPKSGAYSMSIQGTGKLDYYSNYKIEINGKQAAECKNLTMSSVVDGAAPYIHSLTPAAEVNLKKGSNFLRIYSNEKTFGNTNYTQFAVDSLKFEAAAAKSLTVECESKTDTSTGKWIKGAMPGTKEACISIGNWSACLNNPWTYSVNVTEETEYNLGISLVAAISAELGNSWNGTCPLEVSVDGGDYIRLLADGEAPTVTYKRIPCSETSQEITYTVLNTAFKLAPGSHTVSFRVPEKSKANNYYIYIDYFEFVPQNLENSADINLIASKEVAAKGESIELSAELSYKDGNKFSKYYSCEPVFVSSDSGILKINEGGGATGLKPGKATVSAEYYINGKTLRVSKDIIIYDEGKIVPLGSGYAGTKAYVELISLKGNENLTLLCAAYNKDESGSLIFSEARKETFNLGKNIKVTKSFEISGDMIKFILLSDEEKLMPAIGAVFAKGANAAQRPVTFWGDSITAGAGGWTGAEEFPDSYKQSGIVKYPLVTEALSGLKTTNLAVGGENATEIAARQGAVDIVLTSDVSLPAEAGVKTEISLKAANNISCYPLYFDQNDSTSGINPCKINGIEGKLSIVYDSEDSQTRIKQGSKYYFERLENGEAVTAAAGDRIITNAAEKRNSDMLVICMGTNGGYGENVDGLIELIDAMTAKLDYENKEYIVLGLPHGTMADEEKMAAKYGERFIRFHSYLLGDALSDAGIEPTEEDKAAISAGKAPKSLMHDSVHFNAKGYYLIGKLVYNKMLEIGMAKPY